MISILIPIYNDPVTDLVKALQEQCQVLKVPYEIICLDDRSDAACRAKNAGLRSIQGVRYLELAENIGRSRIRNRLAELAVYAYLLFMDGDSRVMRPDYIRNYMQVLHPQKVIYGGRVYSEIPPGSAEYFLHWNYGRQREAVAANIRNMHPYRTFMTNNFVVPKAITEQIRFDESIRRYGYEDNLYALELKKAGIEIIHLDNPLEHIGLEKKAVFLHKTTDALDNLRDIRTRHPAINTRLLKLVDQLERLHLLVVAKFCSPLILPLLKKLLNVPKMPLWVLDIYKLFYFLKS